MTFGERIVFAREQKGLNQKQLAEQLGISPVRLNYWEKDKREPDVMMIWKIIKTLDISGDWLLGIENEFDKKAPPDSEESPETEEQIQARVELLTEFFERMGYLEENGDISDETLHFFMALVDFLDSYFDK